MVDYHLSLEINFNGRCLINSGFFIPKKSYKSIYFDTLSPWLRDLNTYCTLGSCLFGSAKLTKNADLDKYIYSGHGIGFDSYSEFSLPDCSMGKNVIIFGADISSSVHIDNKRKDILIFGEGPTQGLDDITLTTEAKYPINFTQPNKRFVVSLHYNERNSF